MPPSRKYQSEGGPSITQILELLRGSDAPAQDQAIVFQAQVLFWLMGATDGHAKNFSIFLGPGGSYRVAPLYDILTAQPSLDAGQIESKQMRLAMSVGRNRHYRIGEISRRHFLQTGEAAGLPETMIGNALAEIVEKAEEAIRQVKTALPAGFPEEIHTSVKKALSARLINLQTREKDG